MKASQKLRAKQPTAFYCGGLQPSTLPEVPPLPSAQVELVWSAPEGCPSFGADDSVNL
jgi:hypothetical protein